jgi:hypothetical protein
MNFTPWVCLKGGLGGFIFPEFILACVSKLTHGPPLA